MLRKKFNSRYQTPISTGRWHLVDIRISSWKRMTTSTRKAIGSRASTARQNIPISRKVILAGFLSVWLKKCIVPSPPHDKILSWVLLPLYNLLMEGPLDCFPSWFAASNVVFGHWQKLSVEYQIPSREMGKCFLVTGLARGWRCPTHICLYGSHYIVPPSFSQEKSHWKVYILRIFIASRSHSGCGPT